MKKYLSIILASVLLCSPITQTNCYKTNINLIFSITTVALGMSFALIKKPSLTTKNFSKIGNNIKNNTTDKVKKLEKINNYFKNNKLIKSLNNNDLNQKEKFEQVLVSAI